MCSLVIPVDVDNLPYTREKSRQNKVVTSARIFSTFNCRILSQHYYIAQFDCFLDCDVDFNPHRLSCFTPRQRIYFNSAVANCYSNGGRFRIDAYIYYNQYIISQAKYLSISKRNAALKTIVLPVYRECKFDFMCVKMQTFTIGSRFAI